MNKNQDKFHIYHQAKERTMRQNRNEGRTSKTHVFIQPNIGLDSEARESVIEILNINLADVAVFTLKIFSAQWNMRGAGFLDLRALFNQQAQQLMTLWRKMAERAGILGGNPICSLEEFLHFARIEEQPGSAPDILRLLADQEAAIRFLREDVRKCGQEYEDEGTTDLLIRVMVLYEKMAWMLRSYLETESKPLEPHISDE